MRLFRPTLRGQKRGLKKAAQHLGITEQELHAILHNDYLFNEIFNKENYDLLTDIQNGDFRVV